MSLSGSCLCGACRFTATPVSTAAGACHCRQCQRWAGGIYLATDCGQSVVFAEGAPVGTYRASAWGERVFCTTCGSSLVWQTQDGQNQHVSIQCFDDPSQFDLEVELFIDRKQPCYALAGQRRHLTEAEIFAHMALDG